MKKSYNRHPKASNKIFYTKGKKIVSEDRKVFFKRYNVHCNIQILSKDFNLIKKKKKKFTHFNIQYTVHKATRNYLLMKIHRPGFFDGNTYKESILDGNNFILAKCLFAKNYINYNQLKKTDFKYSLNIIKNKNTLKKAIKRRYKKTLSNLSDKEKLSQGVAITKLKIIKRL